MSDDADNKMALSPGTVLNGKYRVESVLGHGGFGITYYARDTSISREVAIKECLPADFAWREGTTVLPKATQYREDFEWARDRFTDEARTLAQFDHPVIVKVYDIFEANDTSYMVTRYEPGWTLPDYLEAMGRTLNEAETRVFLHSLLEGLEQVHEAGYLHRDIKPDNIYITERGQSLLLDFGSARQAVSNRSRPMTSVVTPGYAPFEQYHEDGNQGPWSDLYALAACVHYMLRGKPPPEATLRERNDPYEPLAGDKQLLNSYERNLLGAIDQCLSPNESHRPQSVNAVREVLDRVGSEPEKEDTEPEHEDAESLFEEGEAYYTGRGRSKDFSKAAEWYRKAAEQGDAGAQYKLGGMYRDGVGVPKDDAKAVEWFRKAAYQGHTKAKEVLAKQNPSNTSPKETSSVSKSKNEQSLQESKDDSPIQITKSNDPAVVEKEACEYFSSLGLDPDLRVKDEETDGVDASIKAIGGGMKRAVKYAIRGAMKGTLLGLFGLIQGFTASSGSIEFAIGYAIGTAIGIAILGAILGATLGAICGAIQGAIAVYKQARTTPVLWLWYANACKYNDVAMADIAEYLRSEGKHSESTRWEALRNETAKTE